MAFGIALVPPMNQAIERVRRQFLPGADVVEPHVTVLGKINSSREEVLRAARQAAQRCEPFSVTLSGLRASEVDHYLYLCVGDGAQAIREMRAFLQGVLDADDEPWEFVPHVTLGVFDSRDALWAAAREAGELFMDFTALSLVVVETDESGAAVWRETVSL